MRRRLVTTLIPLALLLGAPPAHAVVGGQAASRDYPYMAGMLFDGELRCGASLISPDQVLTAAHCVTADGGGTLDPGRLSFVLGRRQLQGAGGETIPGAAITVHEGFDDEMRNDVAIVRLARRTALRHIRLADPARQRDLWAAGRQAIVTGWGANASLVLVTSGGTNDLQEVTVPMRSDAECRDNSPYVVDTTVMVCAGERQGGVVEHNASGGSGRPENGRV